MRSILRGLIAALLLFALPLRFAHPAAAAASAATPATTVGFTGVDGMSSTVLQHDQSSFSGLGVRARLAPFSLPGLEVMPGIEYWRNTTTLQVYDIRAQRRDATLAADVRYRFPASSWRPYVGAGFGMHFLSSSVDAPALGVNDAHHSIVKGALALMGGVTFPLSGKFETFFEGKYHLVSDYEQFKISWGLSFNSR